MLKLLLGDPNARKLKRYQPIVSDIQLLEDEVAPLSDDELRGKTAAFQERLANADTWPTSGRSLMRSCRRRCRCPRSWQAGAGHAPLRCAADRRHGAARGPDRQLKPAKASLVATLPSYLNALTGRGVHVVTVNDYLARRDAEWMGQVHPSLVYPWA